MQKFIAHNVYGTNEYGAAVTEVQPAGEPKAVYLASEADDVMAGASQALNTAKQRIRDLELAAKENARYSTEMREEFERRGERIAELEKALTEARCPMDDCDNKGSRMIKVHNWYEQKPCGWCAVRKSLMER